MVSSLNPYMQLNSAQQYVDLDLISSLLSSDILLYESSLPDTLLDWLLDLSKSESRPSVSNWTKCSQPHRCFTPLSIRRARFSNVPRTFAVWPFPPYRWRVSWLLYCSSPSCGPWCSWRLPSSPTSRRGQPGWGICSSHPYWKGQKG